MSTPDRPTPYPRSEAVIAPESRNIVLPDARIVLERFDKDLLPQIGAFAVQQPGEKRLSGEALHAQYAVLSRANLVAFTDLHLFRAKAEQIVEGDFKRYVGGELHGTFRVKKSPIAILIQSTLWDDFGSTVETNYQQMLIETGAGIHEEVSLSYSDKYGDTRSLRLELGEGTYTLRSGHASKRLIGSSTECRLSDTKQGMITGATFSTKTHDGNL